jgi:hypothetical protein
LQLSAERKALQRNEKATKELRQTMNGFVSHEREKFERIAREMQDKDKDLVYMDSKLRKVQELIKNSPVVQSRRVPLKDSTAHNENASDEKVQYSNRMSHASPS